VTLDPRPRGGRFGPAVIGAILIVVGIAFLLIQQLDVDIGRVGWPLFVIVPGVALLAFGLLASDDEDPVVGGMVVTIVGLLLLFQNATGLWATWAYAWALAAPAGSGAGMVLGGLRHGRGAKVREGTTQLFIGLAIFALGFLFFEGLIGLSGDRLALPGWALPAGLIVVGVGFLLSAVTRRRDESDRLA
jgi:hypothetical protein